MPSDNRGKDVQFDRHLWRSSPLIDRLWLHPRFDSTGFIAFWVQQCSAKVYVEILYVGIL
jgi:hypothetical protein